MLGWEHILPGRCWIYDPPVEVYLWQQFEPVELGFPLRAGLYRPKGSPVSSSVCTSCTRMEIVFIRAWDPILPGWCWLVLAHIASRKSHQPLAWIWTFGSANRMPNFCLTCKGSSKGSSNAGFMDWGLP